MNKAFIEVPRDLFTPREKRSLTADCADCVRFSNFTD